MTDSSVTLELLQRLSDENKIVEMRAAISQWNLKMLRSFCRSLGVRIRSKKHEVYQTKDHYEQVLAKTIAAKSAAKARETALSHQQLKNKSYLHLLNVIISGITTSPLNEVMIPSQEEVVDGEEGAALEGQQLSGDDQDLMEAFLTEVVAHASASQKCKKRTLKASIQRVRRLLKEIFPPGSEAARMVRVELGLHTKRLKHSQEDSSH